MNNTLLAGITILHVLILVHVSASFQFYDIIPCMFTAECCTSKYIQLNETHQNEAFETKIYGQHIVKRSVVSHLRAHMREANPKKALALAFHGGTGTGKNYVSKFIAESLYSKGMKSKYVHQLIATKDYLLRGEVETYKDQLKALIETSVKQCGRSLFIFDEVDKIPEELLGIVKPYLDFYEQIDGVDYRQSTFIFLSNTGGVDIMNVTVKHWEAGKKRESLELKDIEKLIIKAALNANGGFQHSSLLSNHVISAHVPFLPLEREHVKRCIVDSLLEKGYKSSAGDIKQSVIDEILEELVFYPENIPIFSVNGCKRVLEKVRYVMEGYDRYKDEL